MDRRASMLGGVPTFGGISISFTGIQATLHRVLVPVDPFHQTSPSPLSNSPPSSQSRPRLLKVTYHLPLSTLTPADRDGERDLESAIIIARGGSLRMVNLPRRYGSDGGTIAVPSIPSIPAFNSRLPPTSSGSANLWISSPNHHAELLLLGVLPP